VGAIYSYFSGKEELLEAVCDHALGQELGRLAEVMAPLRTAREKLDVSVTFWFDFLADRHDEAMFMVQAIAAAPSQPSIRQMLVRRRERLVGVGMMLLQEGVARGELPAWLDIEPTARGYTALLDGIALQAVEEGETYRRAAAERRATVFLDVLYAAADCAAPPARRTPPTD
jgi:AcrR family transcriptional regulator